MGGSCVKPTLKEVTYVGGDTLSRIGATLLACGGIAILVAAARLKPNLILAALAGASTAFLEWLLARARYTTLQRHPTANRGLLMLPILTLTVTSVVCLLLSVTAQ